MDIKLVNNVEQYLSLHKVLDQDYTCTLLFTHVHLKFHAVLSMWKF